MAVLVALGVRVLTLGLGFSFAAPWLALVPVVAAVLFVAWLVALAVGGRTPEEAVRRTRTPQLLGPGGPDDPEA